MLASAKTGARDRLLAMATHYCRFADGRGYDDLSDDELGQIARCCLEGLSSCLARSSQTSATFSIVIRSFSSTCSAWRRASSARVRQYAAARLTYGVTIALYLYRGAKRKI